MDNVALSRRTHASKKGNKENTQPAHGSKTFINRNKPAAPLQAKGNKKEAVLATDQSLKTKADLRSASGVAQKNEQAAKLKKMAAETPKPPAAVPPVKSAPGMYKGKVVQSKIGSIWKSSSTVSVPDLKPSEALTESRRVGMMKSRSKSVSEVSGREARRPAQMRSKSAFDRNAQATKPSTSTRPPHPPPPPRVHSARPPTRTIPATLAATSSRSTRVIPSKAGGSQSSKLKVPVTDKRVNKPAVSSNLSQYRLTMETAEERRAKLSEWLASKGKTLKRPAMTTAAAASKTNAKPEADLGVQSRSEEPQPAAQGEPAPELSLAAHQLHAASHRGDTRVAEPAVHSKTPLVMNTSLELMANSDADVSFSPEGEMDDIVVNLCEALEAMETPSGCSDENPQGTNECNDAGMGDCKDEEDTTEDVVEVLKEEEESDGVETDDEEVECEDEAAMKIPEAEEASVVKYSVKTTPYLQSFKKTLEHEASASASKRKSNIKDLKFLTPVRRSCRIQRNSSRLPTMLVDPDPCVSSLAELVKLDDDANAFIYRKNPALLEDLPDQPKL